MELSLGEMTFDLQLSPLSVLSLQTEAAPPSCLLPMVTGRGREQSAVKRGRNHNPHGWLDVFF